MQGTQPAPDLRRRRFTFTLNNYREEDVTAMKSNQAIRYAVLGREIAPNTSTPHLQGYFETFKSYSITAVRKVVNSSAHYEFAIANYLQNRTYCIKEGDYEEWGEPATVTQTSQGNKEQNRWTLALKAAREGDIDSIPADIQIRYLPNLEKLRVRNMKPEKRSMRGDWLYGPPGTGKSTLAWELFPDAYPKLLNKWFEGYRPDDEGHKVMILDDFGKHHAVLGSHLKIWAHEHPVITEAKGMSLPLKVERVIVTSNYTPEQIWPDDAAQIEAIRRRFNFHRFQFYTDVRYAAVDINEPDFKYRTNAILPNGKQVQRDHTAALKESSLDVSDTESENNSRRTSALNAMHESAKRILEEPTPDEPKKKMKRTLTYIDEKGRLISSDHSDSEADRPMVVDLEGNETPASMAYTGRTVTISNAEGLQTARFKPDPNNPFRRSERDGGLSGGSGNEDRVPRKRPRLVENSDEELYQATRDPSPWRHQVRILPHQLPKLHSLDKISNDVMNMITNRNYEDLLQAGHQRGWAHSSLMSGEALLAYYSQIEAMYATLQNIGITREQVESYNTNLDTFALLCNKFPKPDELPREKKALALSYMRSFYRYPPPPGMAARFNLNPFERALTLIKTMFQRKAEIQQLNPFWDLVWEDIQIALGSNGNHAPDYAVLGWAWEPVSQWEEYARLNLASGRPLKHEWYPAQSYRAMAYWLLARTSVTRQSIRDSLPPHRRGDESDPIKKEITVVNVETNTDIEVIDLCSDEEIKEEHQPARDCIRRGPRNQRSTLVSEITRAVRGNTQEALLSHRMSVLRQRLITEASNSRRRELMQEYEHLREGDGDPDQEPNP